MAKLPTKDFFNRHPLQKFSAARMEYSILLTPGFDEAFDALIPKFRDEGLRLDDAEDEKAKIAAEEDAQALLRWLRRELKPGAKALLRRKLLEREDEIMPEVQRLILRAFGDALIENALHLFVRCKENYSDWILANYENIRYPYAQSMMCLVLGFRADVSAVPFLMNQVEFMEKRYPRDSFSQGPLLALHELCARFRSA